MIKSIVLLGAVLLGVRAELTGWLTDPRTHNQPTYDVISLNSLENHQCSQDGNKIFSRIQEAYKNEPKIQFHSFYESKFGPAVGLYLQDLPAIRVLHNHTLYSLRETNPQFGDILEPSNFIEELPLKLPISTLTKDLAEIQSSRYIQLVKHLIGAKSGINLKLIYVTAALLVPLMAAFALVVLCYFKKYGNDDLTLRHIVACLCLWILAKILLIPSYTFDIAFHHVWKITAVNEPMPALYSAKCFALDYPPLFAYFETFVGYIISMFAQQDFTLSRVFNQSFSFLVLMRMTVIITDLIYFFTILALFRFAQRYNARTTKSEIQRVQYNVRTFGFCVFDGALLAIDNGSFQYNSLVFALIIWSIIFLLSKRELLSALFFCIAVLMKQIAVYYAIAYVGYLLFNYVISFNKVAFQIHWLRLFKLVGIICGCIVVAFYPFLSNIQRVFEQLAGGENSAVAYNHVPTLQYIYAFSKSESKDSLENIPSSIALILFTLGSLGVLYLMFKERGLSIKRFPLYLTLSGVVFIQLIPIVHEKHLLFLSIPLMQVDHSTQGLQSV